MDKDIAKKDYEISFLTKAEEGPHEVMKLIGQHGGEITLEGPVEKIALAYKIKKESAAYFGYFHVTAAPADMKALEQDMNTSAHVLRFLIITPPFVKAKPRPSRPMRPMPAQDAAAPVMERKLPHQASGLPLSNEALEKKIEEILQQ